MSDAAGDAGDAAQVVVFGAVLHECVVRAIPAWIERVVRERTVSGGMATSANLTAAIDAVVFGVDGPLRAFLCADIDEQRSTPLAIVRAATGPVTTYLVAAAVAPPGRDEFDARLHPGDVYGLGPVSWSELGAEVHEAGLHWGAAKAYLHRRRHQ